MKQLIKIILGIIFFVFLVVIVSGLIMGIISEKYCKAKCSEESALGHYLSKSGNFLLDDTCVCFYEDKIKSFRVGE